MQRFCDSAVVDDLGFREQDRADEAVGKAFVECEGRHNLGKMLECREKSIRLVNEGLLCERGMTMVVKGMEGDVSSKRDQSMGGLALVLA